MRAKILGLLLFAGLAFGQNTKEEVELQPVVAKYTNAFLMEDFKVTIHVGSWEYVHTFCPETSVACSHWTGHPSSSDMAGEIWIVQRADFSKEKFGLDLTAEAYQHFAIVHELLHVIWEYAEEEAAVVILTRAINP